MALAKSDQRRLLPSAVLEGELFGQWVAYGLNYGYGYGEDSLDGDGVGSAEHQLLVITLCFFSGGVNGSSFLFVACPAFI